MKKSIFCLLILCLSMSSIMSQCDEVYLVKTPYRNFEITPTSSIFNDFFTYEDENDYSASFATNLWIGAFDPVGNLKLGAQTYSAFQPQFNDFTAGPLSSETGQNFINNCDYFGRVWIIYSNEIQEVIDAYDSNDLNIDNISKDILEWPALGNPHFDVGNENGNTLFQALAPFYDHNLDGIYNVEDGDFPIYDKSITYDDRSDFVAPYVFTFQTYNDNSLHTLSGGDVVQVEVRQINYIMQCASEARLNNSIFTNFELINRGFTDLLNVKIGLWEDIDLGCFDNDWNGCYPSLNASFSHNSVPVENFCNAGVTPFPYEIGLTRNTLLLDRNLSSYHGYFNGAFWNEPASVDPQIAPEFYNFLDGKWRDGTPITVGGYGYNPGSTDVTNYVFPDLPTNPTGWSMAQADIVVGDRRTIMGIDAELDNDVWQPGQIIKFNLANYLYIDKEANHISTFNNWEDEIKAIQDLYFEISSDPSYLLECQSLVNCESDCVWPGDSNNNGYVNGHDILYTGIHSNKAYDNGIARSIQSNVWSGFSADEWMQSINNTNAKYADCSGNGNISALDFGVIRENIRLQNENYVETDIETTLEDPDGITIKFSKEEVVVGPNLFDRVFFCELSLGSKASSIYGLSFDVVFDSTLVAETQLGHNAVSGFIGNSYSFVHSQSTIDIEDGISSLGDDRINFAVVGTEPEVVAKESIFLSLRLSVRPDATTFNESGQDTIHLSFRNLLALDEDGNEIELGIVNAGLPVVGLDVISNTQDAFDRESIQISPNPAQDYININFNSPTSGKLSFYNVQGQKIQSQHIKSLQSKRVSLKSWHSGLYYVKIETNDGQVFQSKIIKTE